MKKKILFIINPISGNKPLIKEKVEGLIDNKLDKEKFNYKIKKTERAKHAIEISENAINEGFDIIIVVGGDGSVNEVAQSIINSEIILGIIPLGSGNGLARHLKIPLIPENAIKLINQLNVKKIDTATCNDNFFVSIAGIGFDALVAEKFAKMKRRGFSSYLKIITREYPFYQPLDYEINIDGKQIQRNALLINFANSDQFGYETSIAPNAKIDDGLIDVCIVKKPPLVELPILAHLLYRKQIDKSKFMEIIKAKKITINQKNITTVNVDGEPMESGKKVEIKINPSSLKVIVP